MSRTDEPGYSDVESQWGDSLPSYQWSQDEIADMDRRVKWMREAQRYKRVQLEEPLESK